MKLKEILRKIAADGNASLLADGEEPASAQELLATLPERVLERQAYLQPGLYIAEINDKGYLGRVLYILNRQLDTKVGPAGNCRGGTEREKPC
jgi:hypothetical protein